jgi:hypothetical protein
LDGRRKWHPAHGLTTQESGNLFAKALLRALCVSAVKPSFVFSFLLFGFGFFLSLS